MADFSISVAEDQFICPICLDLLKEPVTVPCGHSYCMSCITGHWNHEDQRGIYSCPQCRKSFMPRPDLGKNVMIAEMVEKVKKTEPRDAVPAGPGDVKCDVCTGRKNKAFKSCLVCLNSYCQTHFEEFHSDKRHKVIDATGRLKQMICQKHDKILEVFCCTDQQFICVLCTMDEHRYHETVSAAEEKSKMQGLLREMQRTVQQRIQKKEMKHQELREAVESQKRSAQAAVEDSEKIFSDLIRSIEKSRSEVTKLIRAQERASVSRAEERLEQLKQEITDLRRNEAELEQLSDTDDHIRLLQSFQSLSLSGSTKLPRIIISSVLSFDDVRKSVSKLRDQLIQYCREQIDNISGTVKHIQIILGPDFETRVEYLGYFHQFTLDPNTTNKNISLSDKSRTITSTHIDQPYPDHQDRFVSVVQVLCRESVSGRCYWEVDYGQSERLGVSVSYKSISRKGRGNECKFGHNNQSWILLCSPPKYISLHNNIKTKLIVASSSSRIGVYVDHRAGILSFYSVSDTITLIHKVQITFTQPLYPGFSLGSNATVKLCNVKT
ncbi:tripartite motif-containing protein 16-like protein [Sinocyclocheilus grahami]|uniref:tripartite motif-containing protein 16-like protein n=1 Tax=Sinocyclocheilus grahami TaxID=75366 RepID=UPI0007AD2A84|nr:PREDICTED: tripartite motif-containing protein 16-like protein [Sinocyclocheilus grahami]